MFCAGFSRADVTAPSFGGPSESAFGLAFPANSLYPANLLKKGRLADFREALLLQRGIDHLLTETISQFAIKCLDLGGYAGAGVLMALESMIAPIPSEAVMPFVGFLVADGRWNLWLAILATSFGSMVGSLLSYLMGFYGGKPLVLKVGKYLLLDRHDLELTEKFFHRRSGTLTIFISRFIPVVRHLISIPAGVGKNAPGPVSGRDAHWRNPVECVSAAMRYDSSRTLALGAKVFPSG